jgi:ATP-dependent Lon protease
MNEFDDVNFEDLLQEGFEMVTEEINVSDLKET